MEILLVAAAIAAIIGLIYTIWSRRTPQPVRVVREPDATGSPQQAQVPPPDLSMRFQDFDQHILPQLLSDGWEVKKPNQGGVWVLRQEGWEEILWPNAQGQQARIVIIEPLSGRIDLVPMRRRKRQDLPSSYGGGWE